MALRIDIKGHINHLKQKLVEAKNGINNFASSVGAKMAGLGTQILATFAGAFALTQVKSAITSLINEMDKIGKASTRIGISAKAYQELAFSAKLAGVSMERFTLAMSALGPFMLLAANSASRQAKALEVLGIDYAELSRMKPEDQFTRITKAIDGLANATERVGVSRLIFGRAGFEVLGMAANMEEAKKRLEGGIINEKDIKAAEDFNDALTTMATKLKAIVANTGALRELAEILQTLERGGAAGVQQAGRLDPVVGPWLALGRFIAGNSTVANLQAESAKEIDKLNAGTGGAAAARRAADRRANVAVELAQTASARGRGGTAFRVDALRRIGGLGGATTAKPIESMAANMDKLIQLLPPLLQAAVSINAKTPAPNDGGKN